MHVLITGGAGFIGSHTAYRLLARGHRVTVLDNLSSGRRENLPLSDPELHLLVGDIGDADAVAEAINGVDAVLHLAAQVSVVKSVEAPRDSCRDNIYGFVTVLDAARRNNIPRVVYASSAAVYGTPAELPLNEDSPTAPDSPYGLEKRVNDQYADLFRQLYGLSSLGMRYFNVYGPGQDPSSPYSGVISIFADRLRNRQPLQVHGDGEQTRDFVYVGDVAALNIAALESRGEGVLNIGTGTSYTLLQLAGILGAIAGHAPEVHHTEPRPGDIRHSATRIERLREQLGTTPQTTLEEGLKALWESL